MTTHRQLTDPLPFDPFADGVLADPYPWYAILREDAPVHHNRDKDIWILSRYGDVQHALRSHDVFSSAEGIGFGREHTFDLITTDPPAHTRLRRLVSRSFAPRVLELYERRVREIVSDLVDGLLERGTADWVEAVAIPLPITVIAELLGIPVADREDFKRWSNAILDLIGDQPPADRRPALEQQRAECVAYLRDVVRQRKEGAEARGDLISMLMSASDDESLSEVEVVTFCMLLLVAGNETTTNAIANGMHAFLGHPDQLQRLCADPSLVDSAVEEVLRYDAPIQGLYRTLTQDVHVAGTDIPQGARALLLFGSACRDGRVFDHADTFLVDRNAKSHLAFGSGIHACLGAPLARMELRTLARTMLARVSTVVPSGTAVRTSNSATRGFVTLPVQVVPR